MIQLHKKSVIKKAAQIAGSTMLSRFLGVAREILLLRLLGKPGMLSDAFLTGFMIPNSLRRIFAEGALSAAFVPEMVKTVKNDRARANGLMSLSFLVFEGIVVLICALVILFPRPVLWLVVPGFSPEQIEATVPFLQLLMPFIFFVSSSALFAGALQSVNHFFVPAFGPVLLNLSFIAGTVICLWMGWPITILCLFILLGGLAQLLQHLLAYFDEGFSFGVITEKSWHSFWNILTAFVPCFISMSVMEINFIVDRSFASFLPEGSISLIYYANRFVGIPLGVLAVAFSTILLPYFSRIVSYAPKRLSFFLYEAAKLIFWVMFPVTLLMCFFSDDIFRTFSSRFSVEQINQASYILIAFAGGLFFYSFNKILLNVYYAKQKTWIPLIVSIAATLFNAGLNWLVISYWGAFGLALATTLSGVLQTILLMWFLHAQYGFKLYLKPFLLFVGKYCIQLLLFSGLFLFAYYQLIRGINFLPHHIAYWFINGLGFWLWVGPLSLLMGWFLWLWRDRFGVSIYFID